MEIEGTGHDIIRGEKRLQKREKTEGVTSRNSQGSSEKKYAGKSKDRSEPKLNWTCGRCMRGGGGGRIDRKHKKREWEK